VKWLVARAGGELNTPPHDEITRISHSGARDVGTLGRREDAEMTSPRSTTIDGSFRRASFQFR